MTESNNRLTSADALFLAMLLRRQGVPTIKSLKIILDAYPDNTLKHLGPQLDQYLAENSNTPASDADFLARIAIEVNDNWAKAIFLSFGVSQITGLSLWGEVKRLFYFDHDRAKPDSVLATESGQAVFFEILEKSLGFSREAPAGLEFINYAQAINWSEENLNSICASAVTKMKGGKRAAVAFSEVLAEGNDRYGYLHRLLSSLCHWVEIGESYEQALGRMPKNSPQIQSWLNGLKTTIDMDADAAAKFWGKWN